MGMAMTLASPDLVVDNTLVVTEAVEWVCETGWACKDALIAVPNAGAGTSPRRLSTERRNAPWGMIAVEDRL